MNSGAMLARHELLVCIDGDAPLDPQALRWIAQPSAAAMLGASPAIRASATAPRCSAACRSASSPRSSA
jgi:biofilm PGA synthesis N-glycosyltransferase PgaC